MFLLQTIDHERWNLSFSFLLPLTYWCWNHKHPCESHTLYILCTQIHTHTRTHISHDLNLFILFMYTCFNFVEVLLYHHMYCPGTVCLFIWWMHTSLRFHLHPTSIPPSPEISLAFAVQFSVPVVQFWVHFDFVMNAILTVPVHFIVKILFVKFHILLNLTMLLLLLMLMFIVHSQCI